jgi:hypothetical protein
MSAGAMLPATAARLRVDPVHAGNVFADWIVDRGTDQVQWMLQIEAARLPCGLQLRGCALYIQRRSVQFALVLQQVFRNVIHRVLGGETQNEWDMAAALHLALAALAQAVGSRGTHKAVRQLHLVEFTPHRKVPVDRKRGTQDRVHGRLECNELARIEPVQDICEQMQLARAHLVGDQGRKQRRRSLGKTVPER